MALVAPSDEFWLVGVCVSDGGYVCDELPHPAGEYVCDEPPHLAG